MAMVAGNYTIEPILVIAHNGSWDNLDTNGLGLGHDTLAQSLERQAR
jgi:hypothetical protein